MSHNFFEKEKKYILADNGKKCNNFKDTNGKLIRNSGYNFYEPVKSLEGCQGALNWFKTSGTFGDEIEDNVFNFANPSPRPFGCYYYTKYNYKRFVYPRRATSDNSIPSESQMQQVCKMKEIYQENENNEYILLNGINGKTCNDISGYDFIPCENNNCAEECTKAFDYLLEQNVNVRANSSTQKIYSFPNSSARPYGCYYFAPMKKVVYPVNSTKTTSGNSDKFKQQICKRISLERLSESSIPTDNSITYGASDSPQSDPPAMQDIQQNIPSNDQNIQETIVPARKIPFCRIDRDVEKGQDIIVTQDIYVCPSGSSLFCPTNYSVKENIGCVWSSSEPEPSTAPPVPSCKPSESKVIITSVCGDEEVTEEECEGTSCVTDLNENCLCPTGTNITKRTCRKKMVQTIELVGVFDCGQYTLACPENYTLDNNTKYCILNQ